MDRYRSNGLSVQTEIEEIFPPENTRSYTKYTKRKRYTEIMIGCIVLGDETAFPIDISTEKTIGHLKKAIKDKAELNCPPRKLKIWKVDIPESKKNEIYKGADIKVKFGGVKLDSDLCFIGVYFKSQPTLGNIHIIVEKPQPETTVSSMNIIPDEVKIEIKNKVIKTFPHINSFSIDQLTDALTLIWDIEAVENDPPSSQNDPCVKLKMEPSFFKINLPSTITEQPRTMVDLCLPPYKSKSGIDYLNPFYNDPQFKNTVSLVQEKLTKYTRDITVLTGVSGGGKTSTAFGISIQNWSIYVDFSPIGGQYGNFIGRELEKIRARPPKYGQTEEQSKVFDMLDLAIVSQGLLLIKMLVQEKISTQKEWLFAQLRIMNITEITKALRQLHVDDVSLLFRHIIKCLSVKSLILIFDEAQVLCAPNYGEYNGSSSLTKKWNLLQAYIEHLTHLPVTCLISGTYMDMASGISLVASIGKVEGLHTHIVLKLPFLSSNDVLRNLEAVIDLTDVTPKTFDYLGYVLKGRPRNCASFVRKLISERESMNRMKDQELRELLLSWFKEMSTDMAEYLENVCKYMSANNLHPEKAIMDVLRLRVFYNQKFSYAIELLKHSIIPCKSPECIVLSKTSSDKTKININPSLESYLISGIEEFFLNRGKTLVEVFIDNIINLNNIPSIGNEFDAVFITAIIQKRLLNVREELNRWKNGQQFSLPSWITPTMKFVTTSNISGTVPLVKYVNDKTYCYHAIQPEIYSGSDLVLSLMDDDQNVILLSASCTVSGSPIKRKKVKEQLIKSCMKFQYMELSKKRKNPPCLQIGLGNIPADNEEDEDNLEEDEYEQDLDFGGVDYDLDYTENIKNYKISRISERAENHEEIKTSTKNQKHIYVSVELPHRASKRPELFRYNEYGDLVIIVDDRNMEYVFGPAIKNLLERISEN